MYGLKQATVLVFDNLVKNLVTHRYAPIPDTIGVQKISIRQTKCCLYVDDFGVKYFNKDDAHHLLDSLSKNYIYSMDWEEQTFYGLKIDLNYKESYVDISMSDYIKNVLRRFQHPQPTSPQYSPHSHTPIKYGVKIRQCILEWDISLLLDTKGIKYVQQVSGSLLYCARAINATMLPELNTISTEQDKPTMKKEQTY